MIDHTFSYVDVNGMYQNRATEITCILYACIGCFNFLFQPIAIVLIRHVYEQTVFQNANLTVL